MVATRLMTVEEFERMADDPNGVRYELVRGELVARTGASAGHGKVGGRIHIRVGSHALAHGLGEVFTADTGYRLFPDQPTVLSPDVGFVRADRLTEIEDEERVVPFAPDFLVEVLSPNDRMPDLLANVALYLAAGSRLIWVVETRPRAITVFTADGGQRRVGIGETLDGGEVLPGFRLPVADIFAD